MYLQTTLLKSYVVVLDREKEQYGRVIGFIFFVLLKLNTQKQFHSVARNSW